MLVLIKLYPIGLLTEKLGIEEHSSVLQLPCVVEKQQASSWDPRATTFSSVGQASEEHLQSVFKMNTSGK
jgi:hypothetical protein